MLSFRQWALVCSQPSPHIQHPAGMLDVCGALFIVIFTQMSDVPASLTGGTCLDTARGSLSLISVVLDIFQAHNKLCEGLFKSKFAPLYSTLATILDTPPLVAAPGVQQP